MAGPPPKAKPTLFNLPPVSFSKLYHYATPADLAMTGLGCLAAMASGMVLPLFTIVFGDGLNTFNDPRTSTAEIVDAIQVYALNFLLIAIGAGVLTFAETVLVSVATENMMARLRAAYARNLLRLDFAWYDTHKTGEAVARLAESSITVATGMNKVATVLRYSSSLVCGLAIGFTKSWKLTLVVMACAPMFAITLGLLIVTSIAGEKKLRLAYARAGGAANEVFSLSRAVSAFGGEAHESRRYNFFLLAAEAAGIAQGRGVGISVGIMVSTFYMMYGISCYAGAMFILKSREDNPACLYNPSLDGCFTGGQVITTFVAVLLGALSFGQVGPLMGQIAGARAAASDLFGVIEAVPGVDVAADSSELYRGPPAAATAAAVGADAAAAADAAGLSISFTNVTFAYPARPETTVLKNFSLEVAPGERIGVVGTSGSGKSTLVLLVMRAYDPQSGTVSVGGVDVRKWHLPSLRARLGFVQQEPALFGVSIADNIALGVADPRAGSLTPNVPQVDIERAARSANAHDFITALPEGYKTIAGASVTSSQLSGGQRQRICSESRARMRMRTRANASASLTCRSPSPTLPRPQSPAPSSGGRRSCSWTRRRARSTPRASASCRRRSTRLAPSRAPPRSSSRTGSARSSP
jgi:ATP-binding cassette subfamily B (MDR/TAP) protein 1